MKAEPSDTSRTFSASAGRVQPPSSARAPRHGPTKVTLSSTRSALGCIARGINANARGGRPEKTSLSKVVAPHPASHSANFARCASAPGSAHNCLATSSS
ncbi:hypothetical protein GCM10017786_49580 [Amycolatopsis deserti]|uniref:Uncharacterized protein n=1 Tax=Amycolatopsis deserti TaxID=185696 RepID=A0ABQ3J9V7_9PSEU|nr:hypothetical protein GCM10017786_49580 [Amycolatopsis deserti]